MTKVYDLGFIVFCSLLPECIQTYHSTIKLCNKVYIQRFDVYPDYQKIFFTDSLNFRMYVGRLDLEHEYYIYNCNGNNIDIIKVETGSKNCRTVTLKDGRTTVYCDKDTLEARSLNVEQLKRKMKFDL
jgi:hypothetical protein